MPHTEDWCWVHHWFAHWAFVGMCYYARYRRHHGGQAVLIKIVFYPEDKGKSLKDFRLGSTFLRSTFENFIWLQCEQWMVREGCHLLPYLKNIWAILEAFGRWAGGGNTSFTQVRLTSLMCQAVSRHKDTFLFSSVSPRYTQHLKPLKWQKTSNLIIKVWLLKSVLLKTEFCPPKIHMWKP